jgi:hypothetical protein
MSNSMKSINRLWRIGVSVGTVLSEKGMQRRESQGRKEGDAMQCNAMESIRRERKTRKGTNEVRRIRCSCSWRMSKDRFVRRGETVSLGNKRGGMRNNGNELRREK